MREAWGTVRPRPCHLIITPVPVRPVGTVRISLHLAAISLHLAAISLLSRCSSCAAVHPGCSPIHPDAAPPCTQLRLSLLGLGAFSGVHRPQAAAGAAEPAGCHPPPLEARHACGGAASGASGAEQGGGGGGEGGGQGLPSSVRVEP